MTEGPLISIIMPAFNAEQFIGDAIQSALNQSYPNWELIVVNDGSTDLTEQKIQVFDDPRIRYFKQPNKGVSATRNLALREMKGEFFCFLDADDALPPQSISARLEYMLSHDDVDFVDGTIILKDGKLDQTIGKRKMAYRGNPRRALARLDESCFFGPSWMIRRLPNIDYVFNEDMTHAEDLLFFYSISSKGSYAAINQEILHYRVSDNSAMSNIKGIENGYATFYSELKGSSDLEKKHLQYLKKRITRIMFLSYISKLRIFDAFRVIVRYANL